MKNYTALGRLMVAAKNKFLGTFANYAVNGAVACMSTNRSDEFWIETTVGATPLANTDTLTMQLPSGSDFTAVPVLAVAWGPAATPRVMQAAMAITSHNTTTGVTVLTAGGAVAAASTVFVLYRVTQ